LNGGIAAWGQTEAIKLAFKTAAWQLIQNTLTGAKDFRGSREASHKS